MTVKEVSQPVFSDHHNAIDEMKYEVVPILHNETNFSRGKRHIQMKAFNNSYIIYLENNDDVLLGSNTKMYIPIVRNGKIVGYDSKPYPSLDKIQMYHDIDYRAALAFHTDDDNNIHAHGIIGDIVFRPLPPRVHIKFLNKYPDTYSEHEALTNFLSKQTLHHVVKQDSIDFTNWSKIIDLNLESVNHSSDVYVKLKKLQQKIGKINGYISVVNEDQLQKNKPSANNKVIEKISTLNDQIVRWNQGSSWNPKLISQINKKLSVLKNLMNKATLRSKVRSVVTEPPVESKDTVYLELLITVDYYTYFLHGKSEEQLALYMAAFWNSVDIRFRELKNPNIRINIAGLVIETVKGTAPYMKLYTKRCENSLNNLALDVEQVLNETDKHFLLHFGQGKYDLIVGMTRQRLCDGDSFSLGVTYPRAACNLYYNAPLKSKSPAAVLVYDRGGFDGVIVAVHQLGHALGAPDDKEEAYQNEENSRLRDDSKPGGKCSWEAGHLMSFLVNSTNTFHFSSCSIEIIQNFIKSPLGQCLKNKPNVGSPYSKVLPGRLRDRELQCLNSANRHAYTNKDVPTNPKLLMGNETAYINNCTILYCADSQLFYNLSNDAWVEYKVPIPARQFPQPPADGTSCGFKKICFEGNCIDDPMTLS